MSLLASRVLWVALLGAAGIGALGGCATTRGRAEDAMSRGDYLSAVELYEVVVHEDPDDKGARSNLDEARLRALDVMLARLDKDRHPNRAGDTFPKLAEILRLKARWGYSPPARIAKRIDDEVIWARGVAQAHVSQLDAAGLPLRAEDLLRGYADLLARPEFGTLLGELSSAIGAEGTRQCARYSTYVKPGPEGGTPYLAALVGRYCAHFRAPGPPSPELPNVAGALEAKIAVEGLSEPQRALLGDTLAKAFQRTVWYAPQAKGQVVALVSGSHHARFTVSSVSLNRPWTERIPYETTEAYQQAYQEPYTDYETYVDQVPYTDYDTYSRPCGSRLCTDSRPVTRYRTTTKTRPVTRYRTAYRTAYRTVTKYREEARVFVLSAKEHVGSYDSALRVSVDVVDNMPPITASSSATARQTGLEHDVSFPQAGVAPSQPNLMTDGGWFGQRMTALAQELVAAGGRQWRDAFCGRSSYDLEAASRCAYQPATQYPAGVTAALVTLAGQDADPWLSLPQAVGR